MSRLGFFFEGALVLCQDFGLRRLLLRHWANWVLLSCLLAPTWSLAPDWSSAVACSGGFVAILSVGLGASYVKALGRLVLIVSSLFVPVVVWYSRRFGISPGDEVLTLIRMSDLQGGKEFLSDISHDKTVWVCLSWELLIIIAVVKRREVLLDRPARKIALLLGLGYLSAGVVHYTFLRGVIPLTPWVSHELVLSTYPFSLLQPLTSLTVPLPVAQSAEKTELPLRVDVGPVRQTYILVIGESARADHLGFNGYERPTTPLLDAIEGVISFPHVRSVSDCTYYAVPGLLKMMDAQLLKDLKPSSSRPTVLDYFKAAGFFTAFISMQELSLAEMMGVRSDHTRILRSFNPDFVARDEIVLPELKRVLMQGSSRRLIVLHLLGSHFEYSKRYPVEHNVFRGGGDLKRDRVAEYDNTIVYSDWILSEILNQAKITPGEVIVAYASDHGENLMDDDRQRYQHCGITTHFDTNPATFFWGTRYRDESKLRLLESNSKRYVGQEMIGATLLDLAGIHPQRAQALPESLAVSFAERSRRQVLDNGHLIGFTKDGMVVQ